MIWDLSLDVGPLLYGFICLVVPCTLAMYRGRGRLKNRGGVSMEEEGREL